MSLLFTGLVVVSFVVIAIFLAAFLRYCITESHLEIRWLFVPLRRIRLREIRFVSTKPVWYAEKWYNTFRLRGRRLIIYRRNGQFRPIAISPAAPFVFKAELDAAVERVFPRRLRMVVNTQPEAKLEVASL